MKYALKAKDGSYYRWPGECGSSHTTDAGCSVWTLDYVDLYDHQPGFLSHGKFSKEEGAEIVGVEVTYRQVILTDYKEVKID